MKHSPIRFATGLVLITALISGTNNFLTKIAVTAVKDPLIFTTLKNAVVALLLIGIILVIKKWGEIKTLTKRQILKLFAIGAVGGSLPFALFFIGLSKTSAVNAALIHKTLFLWVLLFAIPILKEKIGSLQWLGIATIFAANTLMGGFVSFKYNTGELMILAATILWAVENIIAKVVLKDVSSITVAASRMVIGSLILTLLVFARGGASVIYNLGLEQWGWTFLTSGLLLGYVLTWYTALKYAPATYVATLLVPATLITNVLSAVFITKVFTINQFVGACLFMGGIILTIMFVKRTADQLEIRKQLWTAS